MVPCCVDVIELRGSDSDLAFTGEHFAMDQQILFFSSKLQIFYLYKFFLLTFFFLFFNNKSNFSILIYNLRFYIIHYSYFPMCVHETLDVLRTK